MHGVDTPITVGVEDKLKPGTFFYSCACARGRQNVLYTLHGVRGSGHATAHGASLYLYIYWVKFSHCSAMCTMETSKQKISSRF